VCGLKFFPGKSFYPHLLSGYESEEYLKIKKGKMKLKCEKCNEKVKNCNELKD